MTACQQTDQDTEGPHPTVLRVEPNPTEGSVTAAVVGDHALAHTAQVLPYDQQGNLVGERNLSRQVEQVLTNLETALEPAGSGLDHLIRVNVYATSNKVAEQVRKKFSKRFSGDAKPTVSYVVSTLPHEDAQVAMDAVGTVPTDQSYKQTQLFHSNNSYRPSNYADVGIMPATNRIYFSGQVAEGQMKQATTGTMEALHKSLEYMNLDWSDVVQLKAFMHPMADRDLVAETMASFFEGETAPTMVFVEWHDASYLSYLSVEEEDGPLPIEIELLAARPTAEEAKADTVNQRVTYHTPPWMSAPQTYSRIAEQHSGGVMYTSSLYGSGADAASQLQDMYSTLEVILKNVGGDFNNLTKGTYYVTDKSSSEALNKIRTQYYPPNRPPTSSKMPVRAVGRDGHAVTFAMIGSIPSEDTP